MVHTYRILPFSFIRVEIQSLARKITCFKHQKSHSKWSFANWECMQSYRVTGSTHHCFGCPLVKKCTYNTYIYIPGTQLTSIFEGQPEPKQGPNFNQNKGHLGSTLSILSARVKTYRKRCTAFFLKHASCSSTHFF